MRGSATVAIAAALLVTAMSSLAVPPGISMSPVASKEEVGTISVQATQAAADAAAAKAAATTALDLANAANTLASSAPQFVAGGAFISRADLAAGYPASATTLGKLAHVSDLWGSVRTTVVCEYDTVLGYYWRPQRTDYATTISQTSGPVVVTSFGTAPVVYFVTPPSASMQIVLPTTGTWYGQTYRFYAPSSINALFPITITGLVGGGTLPLVQGTDKVVTFTPSGWKAN